MTDNKFVEVGLYGHPQIQAWCGIAALCMCFQRQALSVFQVRQELPKLYPDGVGHDYASDGSGNLSTTALNVLLGAYCISKNVTLVHAIGNHHNKTVFTEQTLLTHFPAGIKNIFMWTDRQGTGHYQALLKHPDTDIWYVLDSLKFAGEAAPRALTTDHDWKTLQGEFWFFAALDPHEYGQFGYIPQQHRKYFPADKTTLPLAAMDKAIFVNKPFRSLPVKARSHSTPEKPLANPISTPQAPIKQVPTVITISDSLPITTTISSTAPPASPTASGSSRKKKRSAPMTKKRVEEMLKVHHTLSCTGSKFNINMLYAACPLSSTCGVSFPTFERASTKHHLTFIETNKPLLPTVHDDFGARKGCSSSSSQAKEVHTVPALQSAPAFEDIPLDSEKCGGRLISSFQLPQSAGQQPNLLDAGSNIKCNVSLWHAPGDVNVITSKPCSTVSVAKVDMPTGNSHILTEKGPGNTGIPQQKHNVRWGRKHDEKLKAAMHSYQLQHSGAMPCATSARALCVFDANANCSMRTFFRHYDKLIAQSNATPSVHQPNDKVGAKYRRWTASHRKQLSKIVSSYASQHNGEMPSVKVAMDLCDFQGDQSVAKTTFFRHFKLFVTTIGEVPLSGCSDADRCKPTTASSMATAEAKISLSVMKAKDCKMCSSSDDDVDGYVDECGFVSTSEDDTCHVADVPSSVPLTAIATQFHELKSHGPTHVCDVCRTLNFRNHVCNLKPELLTDLSIEQHALLQQHTNSNMICLYCQRYLIEGRTPPCSLLNGFCFPELPAVVDSLTDLEERLVSLRVAFMCIVRLSYQGQLGLKGGVCNVPLNLAAIQNSLPRLVEEMDTVFLQFKTHSDCNK